MELKELRKILKPLGFKIKTQTNSFGKFAHLVHIETGKQDTGNVYTKENIAFWRPARELLPVDGNVVDNNGIKIIGLERPNFK